jgi:hypothetical protein
MSNIYLLTIILLFSFSSMAQVQMGGDIDDEAVGDSVSLYRDGSSFVGDSLNEGPLTTRYYLTSNALPSKKGDHYVMLHLIGPEVNLALSDNFTLGLVASWWAGNPVAMNAKYTFNSKTKTHFAIGTFVGYSSPFEPDPGETGAFGGVHYAMITRGNRRSNISLSLGYSHYDEGIIYEYDGYRVNGYVPREARDLMDKSTPELTYKTRGSAGFVGLSFMTPLSKKVSFIFDGMAFIGSRKTATYSEEVVLHDVTYVSGTHWEGWFPNIYLVKEYKTDDFAYKKGKLVNEMHTEFNLSPSIRVKGKRNSAWQFAILINPLFSKEIDDSWDYIPLPSVSWLKRF